MSENKFTPGPWAVEPMRSIDEDDTRKAHSNWPGRGFHMGISTSKGVPIIAHGDTEEETIANAHLIAAAPEMYEALKDMVAIAQQDDWHNALTGRQIVLKAAEAALKKASGQ